MDYMLKVPTANSYTFCPNVTLGNYILVTPKDQILILVGGDGCVVYQILCAICLAMKGM